MAYKITRSVVHNTNHNMHKFVDWIIYDISFVNDIQPIYPDVTEQEYYAIFNDLSLLVEPLSWYSKFFIDSPGFIDYSYSFNGVPDHPGVTDLTQEFLFDDQQSYVTWQLQENEKSNTRLCMWKFSLEEKSIDFSNVSIEGNQMVNADTGETSDLSIVKYLSAKYFILRNTKLSIIHTIV
jgi:hypothetical protein